MSQLLKIVEADFSTKRKDIPAFSAGDTINVHVKITEGAKERIQTFQGVVIQRKNPNTNGESFTVRKISAGIAVERIFPLLSPSVDKVELIRKGAVGRARIFYIREKIGKSAKIKENKRVEVKGPAAVKA